jgi:hypothetical protein
MQQKEKITKFVVFALPVVCGLIEKLFKSLEFQIERKASGLDTYFTIHSGEKQIQFNIYNLLLEIAAIDRDEDTLRFDDRLCDFEYFAEKATVVTASKLKVLFKLLGEDDIDKAIDSISSNSDDYERIRIWKIQQSKS